MKHRNAIPYLLALVLLCWAAIPAMGATYSTDNFVVTAESEEFAKQVALTAEGYRKQLAIEWLDEEIPTWKEPCPVTVKAGTVGAGGATNFDFDKGHVFGWRMTVQGTHQRILDSVIPHEVGHTILATAFRRPLPRWADEGFVSQVEHESEIKNHINGLVSNWGHRYALSVLVEQMDYPADGRRIAAMYGQGYTLTKYLVQRGGPKTFLSFLEAGYRNDWDSAVLTHYGYSSLRELEQKWEEWMFAGRPEVQKHSVAKLPFICNPFG